ncbi:MAG: hypothetical protein OEQ29_08915 [Alphaproteobacteria bacterium]|nr:hypothetical protein [Alphaproteobacteria bacterium]
MGTKENPTPHDAYEKAEPDEPMFVLLARDPIAPALVRMWARARELAAREMRDMEKVREADECADRMEDWHNDHPDHGFNKV